MDFSGNSVLNVLFKRVFNSVSLLLTTSSLDGSFFFYMLDIEMIQKT